MFKSPLPCQDLLRPPYPVHISSLPYNEVSLLYVFVLTSSLPGRTPYGVLVCKSLHELERRQDSFPSHAVTGRGDHPSIGPCVCDGLIQIDIAMKQHSRGESWYALFTGMVALTLWIICPFEGFVAQFPSRSDTDYDRTKNVSFIRSSSCLCHSNVFTQPYMNLSALYSLVTCSKGWNDNFRQGLMEAKSGR